MSNETSQSNRVPAGVPTGGQFAASTKSESGVSLGAPAAVASTPTDLPPGMPVGETTPVEEISEGDFIVHNGRLHEITAVIDPDDGGEDAVQFETVCGDDDDWLGFNDGATVQKVGDDARYLYEEDAKVMFPDRVFGEQFDTEFGIIETPDRSQNWETIPDGTPEDRVWSQVEGFTDDGRYDYGLVPGYSSDALNYVITERPWADADHARIFDSN